MGGFLGFPLSVGAWVEVHSPLVIFIAGVTERDLEHASDGFLEDGFQEMLFLIQVAQLLHGPIRDHFSYN